MFVRVHKFDSSVTFIVQNILFHYVCILYIHYRLYGNPQTVINRTLQRNLPEWIMRDTKVQLKISCQQLYGGASYNRNSSLRNLYIYMEGFLIVVTVPFEICAIIWRGFTQS